ncbi:hypothetical protein AB1M95_04435 [Sulfitobacter sp. LCG007]
MIRARMSLTGLLAASLLGSCAVPGPYFERSGTTRVQSGGSVFDVRVRGRLAEAVRVNPQYAPRLGPLGLQAARAMSLVSGCAVTEVRGDQAVATGLLDCGDGPPPDDRLLPAPIHECAPLGRFPDDRLPLTYPVYECRAVP